MQLLSSEMGKGEGWGEGEGEGTGQAEAGQWENGLFGCFNSCRNCKLPWGLHNCIAFIFLNLRKEYEKKLDF